MFDFESYVVYSFAIVYGMSIAHIVQVLTGVSPALLENHQYRDQLAMTGSGIAPMTSSMPCCERNRKLLTVQWL
jgi:hypothetical protein